MTSPFGPHFSSAGGGASFKGFTDGSVIFVASEQAAEDNSNFFWDDTENALLLGRNSADLTIAGSTGNAKLITESTSTVAFDFEGAFYRNTSTNLGANLGLLRSRASGAAVADGDTLGLIQAYGHDGTDFQIGGQVFFSVDGTVGANQVPSKLTIQAANSSGTLETHCQVGGSTVTVSGLSLSPAFQAFVDDEVLAIEAMFNRFSDTPAAGANFFVSKARGTKSSPTTVSAGDTIGLVGGVAYDGTDYNQVADIQFKVGDANDEGDIQVRTRDTADGSPVNRMTVHQEGLIDVGGVGTGSYSLVDGSSDLGVGADLEVLDDIRVGGEIGIKVAPANASLIKGEADGSTVITGVDMDIITSRGGAPPAAGVNVLAFEIHDETTFSATYSINVIRCLAEYDRATAPTGTNNQKAVNIVGYGTKSNRAIGSGTYNWHGVSVTATNPDSNARLSGTGTFEVIDFISEGFDYENWTDPTTVPTLTRLAAKLNGKVVLSETIKKKSGVTDTTNFAAGLQMSPAYQRTAGGLGSYNITRHHYIEYLDVDDSAGNTNVTDGCTGYFDAAPGTHHAIDSGTTKSSPGTVDAWEKKDINGTIYFGPLYTSKTS